MVVITVAPKQKSLFDISNSKAYNLLSFVYKLYHVAFGLDFGFFKFKSLKIKLIIKLLSFVQSLMLCYICSHDVNIYNMIYNIEIFFWFTIFLLQYLTYVLFILFFKSDTTYYSLLQDLEVIDLGLNVDTSSYNLEIKNVVAIFTSLFYKAVVQTTYCNVFQMCLLPFFLIIIFTLLLECSDFVHITYTFVFYSIYCRLNKLILILKMPNSDLASLQHLYKSLVDLAEKHKAAFDMVFLASLTFFIPDAMVTIYISVWEIISKRTGIEVLLMNYFTIISAAVLTFFPVICADALTSEANKLKLVLYDKLLQEHDEERIREVERFIGYVDARGFRFYICQIIPLDANLLSMVLRFCVTYLIVLIQFTNL